jgi:hypothetical protein
MNTSDYVIPQQHVEMWMALKHSGPQAEKKTLTSVNITPTGATISQSV